MKLNLGCNQFYVPGFINIDIDPTHRTDLIEDCETLLSFRANTVDEIYAGHLLEHIINLRSTLMRWYELLKPGGICTITVPDGVGAVDLWRQGKTFPGIDQPYNEGMLQVATGSGVLPGDDSLKLHRRVFDSETLQICMEYACFKNVHPVDDHEAMVLPCSALGWQIAMEGTK